MVAAKFARVGGEFMATLATLSILSGCAPAEDEIEERNIAVTRFSEVASGYESTVEDWIRFIECWNVSPDKYPRPSKLQIVVGPTGPDKLANFEVLQRRLPKSYVEFRNALHQMLAKDPSVLDDLPLELVISAHDIEPYRVFDPEDWLLWYDAVPKNVVDEIYYRYGYISDPAKKQDPVFIRRASFDHLVYLGDFHNLGRLALNSNEISRDGEWEAWNLSWRLPGALRYRSFAELMQSLYIEHSVITVKTTGHYDPELVNATCAAHLKTAANWRPSD